MNEEYKLGEG